ncbi:MAG: Rpn family recombination-promoting nuclease/putative transposase [Spirochaetales bacterium]|nr:Rpn family recombination-promoting nuclease/putative transposase [Spirochaetales bacterium]
MTDGQAPYLYFKGTVMAEKDMTEKTLESYNDVFADIVNGFLFKGEQVVKEDELEAESEHSVYKGDDKLHEQERDVAKYWKNGKIRIALFGFENQTAVDKNMPLRVFGYDGASYRNQLNHKKKELYPVITLVLYFGNKPWNKPKNLLGCLDVPEKLKPYVHDYQINLFEVCRLTEEQLSYFKSDFKIIADYFVKSRKNPDYKGSKETIKHVDEFFKLMKVLTKDKNFESEYNTNLETLAGGDENMNMHLTNMLNREKAAGILEGKSEGKIEGNAELIQKFIKNGNMTVEQIADIIKLPVEKVRQLAEMDLTTA